MKRRLNARQGHYAAIANMVRNRGRFTRLTRVLSLTELTMELLERGDD
jgi:hypothetical protein